MKNIFKIHFFFYITMIVALFTGNIIDFLNFTSIILVHEIGHLFGGFLFKWNVLRVVILPFGGLTVFNQMINTSLFEQFIVTILGPLFQIVFFVVLKQFYNLSSDIIFLNYILLLFNLLPIYPLDGSKLLYIFLCILFPFKLSHLLIIFVSFITCFFGFFILDSFDLLIVLILVFLLISVFKEFMNHNYIFNKFLLERFNYNLKFSKIKTINKLDNMYFCFKHVFFINGKYITEKNMLMKRFDKYDKL